MNKIFTKVATLSVGLALAIGVGVAVGSKAPANAEAADLTLCQWYRSNATSSWADVVTQGFALTQNVGTNSASRKDGSSADTEYYIGVYTTGDPILTTSSTRTIKINTKLGGGTGNKDLSSPMYACYLTNNGSKITASQTTITSKITTKEGDDYSITMPTPTTNVYGVMIYHIKTASYNVNYYSFSLVYDTDVAPATAWTVDDISDVYPGRKIQSTVTATQPSSSAVLPALTYVSGDTDVFTVDSNGVVTTVAAGTATLTVRNANNTISATATVTVTAFPAVDSRITVGGSNKYIMYATYSEADYELTGISSGNLGEVTAKGDAFGMTYKFDIVAGAYANTVAFKVSDNAYIGYTGSDNKLYTITSKNNQASWVVTDTSVIWADSYDTDTVKVLRFNYNNGNSRFATYASTFSGPDVSFYEVADQSLTGISVADINIYPNRTKKLTIAAVPAAASLEGATYTFSSDTPSVATIDADGVVTSVTDGTSEITVTATINNKQYQTTCTVTVDAFPEYSGVTLNKYYVFTSNDGTNDYEMTSITSGNGNVEAYSGTLSKNFWFKAVGGFYTNTIAFQASDGKYLKSNSPTGTGISTDATLNAATSWVVKYENSTYTIDNSVTYGNTGARQLIFNKSTPRIAFYAPGANYNPVDLVEITNPITDFTIEEEKTLVVGTSDSISVTYVPANPTDSKALTWVSSDTDVVTVDSNGGVTAVGIGEATITASRTIGETFVERTCAVSVIDSVAQHKGTLADPYTIQEAYYIAKDVITKDYDDEDVVKTGAYIKGIITKVDSRTTSTLTFWVGDNASQMSAATKGFEVFKAANVYDEALATRYSSNPEVVAEFVVGATVVVSGNIVLYNEAVAEFQAGGSVHYSSYIEALDFARGFNSSLESVCDDEYGNTDPDDLDTAWKAQNTEYGKLEDIEKAHILEASPDEDGNDIEQMVAKYDYIVGKYNTSKTDPYNDFLGRIDAGEIVLKGERINLITTISENTTVTMIIVITSIIGVTAIGGYFLFKKKER